MARREQEAIVTSFTPSLRLWQGTPLDPAIRNAWAPPLNTNDNLLEAAILGVATVNLAGLTTYTLTTANGSADQARASVQNYVGALTANCVVTMPNVQKTGWALNQTTGGHNVILTSGAGAQLTIPPTGSWFWYDCDGSGNVFSPTVSFGGISGLGSLALTGGLTAASATIGGFQAVTNNAGTWGINISGTAAAATTAGSASTVPWTGISGKPYAFNQSTDIAAIPTFTRVSYGDGHGIAFFWNGTNLLAGVDGTGTPGALVANNGGTYAINISGTAAAASAVPWTGVSGKPYAFNQSTDIGASPTFTSVSMGNQCFLVGGSSPTLSLASGYGFVYGGGAISTAAILVTNAYMQANGALGGQTGGGAWFGAGGANPGPWTGPIGFYTPNGVAGSAFFTVSDRRQKEDIEAISPREGLDWVMRGRPVKYTMLGSPSAGFIAQEDYVNGRKSAVRAQPDSDAMFADGDGIAPPGSMLTRDYQQEHAYQSAAIQWLVQRLKELGEDVAELRALVAPHG